MNLIPTHAPTAVELRQALDRGQTTPQEIARQHLARIEALEPTVHAWKHLDPPAVLRQAQAGGTGLLAGLPVGVKDIIDTADMPTGYGSSVYEGHQPREDADAVRALRVAGACLMGKTVSTEFAYFTPGATANPWNPAHSPGGSSSGSAAAVACGMVPLALGTQTAGSVVRPASYCGVFGLKPGFGQFSMRGIKAFSPSLDTLGWFARSADDLELMRCALAGLPFEPLEALPPNALRLLACRTPQWPGADAGGQAAWAQALERSARAGVQITQSELDDTLARLFDAQKLVMAFEAAQQLAAEVDRYGEALGPALHQIVATGRAITPEAHQQALAFARDARAKVLAWMGEAHAVLTLSATGEAPRGLEATGDPMFGRLWTLLGLPCVNVPGLRGPQGLPIGLQLVGRPGSERALLEAARTLHAVIAPA